MLGDGRIALADDARAVEDLANPPHLRRAQLMGRLQLLEELLVVLGQAVVGDCWEARAEQRGRTRQGRGPGLHGACLRAR